MTTTDGPHTVNRRKFIGYLLGGATVVAAADLGMVGRGATADAGELPTLPQPAEIADLSDLLTLAAAPTSQLITVTINDDGTASFELPRTEVGQGITTAAAMLIAEELDLPVDKVHVTLAPARPELLFNQITGGSNTIHAMYTPIRVAAAVAKGALLQAAATVLGDSANKLTSHLGHIVAPDGRRVDYGRLSALAANEQPETVEVELKDENSHGIVGTPVNRIDALDAVTGTKQFATDLDVADALPTMVCRAPTLNGTPNAVNNADEVRNMPGVTHVAIVPTGVAVRASTFGQCIDAVRALDVSWNDGPVAGMSDEDALAGVRAAEAPAPELPAGETVSGDFTFWFRSNSAMDTNSAVADVRDGRAEIWASLKNPNVAQGRIAEAVGIPLNNVTVHVVQGGGSFGRRLFDEPAIEAARISQAMGVPVKLMWHRADDARVGRTHPLATSRIRACYAGDTVLGFQQAHTSIETDFRHGLGDIITAKAADLPAGLGNMPFAQVIFQLTTILPYDFGAVGQSLVETDTRFNTSSMRNIYSPDVRTANELIVDQLAQRMGTDPLEFRLAHLRNGRLRTALETAAEKAEWGKELPEGMAQGIGVHVEYKGVTACIMEIDCRPETVGRKVRNAVTGPRVTKATMVIDCGRVINPRGVEAQMQGCVNDGIAMTLTSSLHLRDGHFQEASWDNYFYTRQWNTPPELDVVVLESTEPPGGVGEAGVAASAAAAACAYARATAAMPTEFPINHRTLSFEPKPYSPPVPQSPTDGLDHTY
ncbi:isoquinoline 1-oxidoreductase, beta subunit [Prauserella aidingensis]|uniref:molybdopterin cofactor-binding domain-containing protein n=1 Tax=Prauserella aidingensis TaxID=387890 RepID=UPI0020A277B3|nr:molybdopterin cofactor-binding domain-containing protein [Prauserella aidingensis]MCP2251383.1 isoquinoline 1-oxidoreductase, beta subunit [Prauserella aidingensis]